MKRLVLLLLLLPMLFVACDEEEAKVWEVETVPNTRLEGDTIHVSDPDDFLSDSAERLINQKLESIRSEADVFLVALATIGDAESKSFATKLLNYWGIGDAGVDNGVLLLFVEDQHALEFETGYGAEATLTDALCSQIFNQKIKPYFVNGDYEEGLCAGVTGIAEVYGGDIPTRLKATTTPDSNAKDTGKVKHYGVIFGLFALFIFVMPIVGFVFWVRKRKVGKASFSDRYHSFEEGGVTYVEGLSTNWSGSPWEGKGCLGGMTLGLSVFAILIIVLAVVANVFPNLEGRAYYNWVSISTFLLYLTWVCFRQNQRALRMANELAKHSISPKLVYKAAADNLGNKIATWMAPWLGWAYYLAFKRKVEQSNDFQCPKCSSKMKRYSGFLMPTPHAVEERMGALKYTPYRCGSGHVIVLKEHGKHFSMFATCSKCGAYTMRQTNSVVLSKADYSHNGEKEETYVCQHCGETITKTVTIPMLVHYSSGSSSSSSYSSSSSSGRSYSSSSRSSSGGSFGGGRSGGGGYSGRW